LILAITQLSHLSAPRLADGLPSPSIEKPEAQMAYEGLCRGRAKALVSFGMIVMIHRGPASSFTDLITPTYFEPRKVMAVGRPLY
jgi:hypothetical protein